MTFEDFVEKYRPITCPHRDAGFNSTVFDPSDPELSLGDPACVWTWHEEDGVQWIGDGYHYVNRLGHFITEVPAPAGEFIEVILDD